MKEEVFQGAKVLITGGLGFIDGGGGGQVCSRGDKGVAGRGPLRIGGVIRHLAQRKGWGRLKAYRVWQVWEEAVGETVARNATPYSLRRGTLTVICSGPQWMHQLHMLKEMIRERLNEAVGREIVKDIRFRAGALRRPSQEPPVETSSLSDDDRRWIEEVLGPLKDEDLREVLRRVLEKARAKRR